MEESDQSTEVKKQPEVGYRAPGTKPKCHKCVYRRPVPGNAHIECVFDWTRALTDKKVTIIPLGHSHGIQKGWYMFPMLYDPIWMVIECQAASQVIDENYIVDDDKMVKQMVVMRYILNHPLIVKKVESGGKEDDKKIESDIEPATSPDEDSGTGEGCKPSLTPEDDNEVKSGQE